MDKNEDGVYEYEDSKELADFIGVKLNKSCKLLHAIKELEKKEI